MTTNEKKRSKLLRKYIKINFLVIFLPAIIIIIIYCVSIQKNYREKYLDTIEYSVNEKMWKLESRMNSIASLALQISQNSELTPYKLKREGYSLRNSIEEIYSYKAESEYFDELAICLNGSDTLYTSRGTVDIDIFLNSTFWPEENFSTEDLKELIHSKEYYGGTKDGQYVRSKYTQYSIMTYPLRKTYGSYYGTLIGIYENDWKDIFGEEVAESDKRLVIVCDNKVNMLYTQMPDDKKDGLNLQEDLVEPLTELLQEWDESEKYYEFSFCGEDYVGKIAHSSVSGWYLLNMVEERAVSNDILIIYCPMILLIVLSMFLVTLSLSVILSMHNYKPIKRLLLMIDKKEAGMKIEDEHDELLFLNEYIRKLLDEQNTIEERADDKIKFTRMELIKRLLRSSLDVTSSEVEERMEYLGVRLDKEYMAAVIIVWNGNKSVFELKLQESMRECRYSDFYFAENIYKEFDVFLACVEDVKDIVEFAKWLLEEMGEDAGIQIGIGNTYSAVESLKFSLIEAIIAVESGTERIVCYSDITIRSNDDFYCKPLESEKKLKRLLTQGTIEELEKTLNELKRELMYIWRFSSDTAQFFLMNRILGTLFEDSLSLNEKTGEKYLYYTDLEEFLEQIQKFCQAELQCQMDQKVFLKDLRIKNIVAFIEENYMSHEMSLAWVAERFDMKGSYLGKLFKAAMGKNFIDYITDKRLNLAAELLVDTDDTIYEIVEKVGYSDVASFTRKFARHFLVTPGNYRRIEKEKLK